MWRLWFDGQTFNIFCCLFFFFRYRSLTCLPSHVTPWSLFSVACFRLTAFAMQGEARQTRWDSKSWGSWLVWAHQTNMSLWPELLDKKLVWPQLTWSFIAAALLEGCGQGQSGLNIYMPEYLLPAGHPLVELPSGWGARGTNYYLPHGKNKRLHSGQTPPCKQDVFRHISKIKGEMMYSSLLWRPSPGFWSLEQSQTRHPRQSPITIDKGFKNISSGFYQALRSELIKPFWLGDWAGPPFSLIGPFFHIFSDKLFQLRIFSHLLSINTGLLSFSITYAFIGLFFSATFGPLHLPCTIPRTTHPVKD